MTNKKAEILKHRNLYDTVLGHAMTPVLAGLSGFSLYSYFNNVAAQSGFDIILPGLSLIATIGLSAAFLYAVIRSDLAKVIAENDDMVKAPENHIAVDMIRNLAQREGLNTMPRVCFVKPGSKIVPQGMPFAGAAGHTNSGVILISEDLHKQLSSSELEGVLAHEIEHIKRNDTQTSALQRGFTLPIALILIAHAIGTTGTFIGALLSFGTLVSFPSALPLLAAFGLNLLASIASGTTSRSFERRADRGAANLTNNPWALSSALSRIIEISTVRIGRKSLSPDPNISEGVLKFIGKVLKDLTKSHPAPEYRHFRLKNPMVKALIKREGTQKMTDIFNNFQEEIEVFEQSRSLNKRSRILEAYPELEIFIERTLKPLRRRFSPTPS